MREFSYRSEVSRQRKALWVVILVVVALLVAAIWAMTYGKRILISRIADAIRETPMGNLEFGSLEATGQGIELVQPRLTHPATGKLVGEAERVVLSLTLRDLLKSWREVASVTVTIDGLRIYPRYAGNGHWDLEEMLREVPEREMGKLREIHLRLNDARVETALNPEDREDLSSYIESFIAPHRDKARKGLADWLESAGANLQSGFRDDLEGLIADARLEAPEKLELALDGRIDLGLEGGSAKGDLELTKPFPSSVNFRWSREAGNGQIILNTGTAKLELGRMGWLQQETRFWDLGDAKVERFELVLVISPGSRVRAASANGKIAGIVLFPRRAHELVLESAKLSSDESNWRASLDMSAGGSSVSLNVDTGEHLHVQMAALPLSRFLAEVKGVSASTLSGDVKLKLPLSSFTEVEAEGKLELGGISLPGAELPGSVKLDGRLSGGNGQGTLAWLVDGRKLVSGRVSGDASRLRMEVTARIRRGDIPPGLLPEEGMPSWLREAHVELAAFYDVEQQSFAGRTSRAEFTMESAQARTLAASFEFRPGSFAFTVPQLELLPSYPSDAAYREFAPEKIALSLSLRGSAAGRGWSVQTESRGKAHFADERVYFNVTGGGSPENLTLDLNAGGVLLDSPAGLSASVTVRPNSVAVSSLDVLFASSRITGEGDYTPASGRVRFAYKVDDLPLHLWIPFLPILDPIDGSGVVSGVLRGPEMRIVSFIDRVGVEVNGRKMLARNMSATGAFESGVFRIVQGSAQIGGEILFFEGSLGEGDFSLRAGSDDCSLFGMVPHILPEINLPAAGEGELRLKLSGSYTHPKYEVYYRQVAGSLAEEKIRKFEFEMLGDADRVEVAKTHLSMGEGYLDAKGTWWLGGGGESTWSVVMTDFPAAPLAYAYPGLEKLQASGLVSGEIRRITGDDSQAVAQGYFVLEDGMLLGTGVDAAEIAFNIQPAGIYIDKLEMSNPEYIVSASGFWSRTPGETSINLNIPYLDLALLSPLVPEPLQPLSGEVGFLSEVTRDESGTPVLVGSFLTAGAAGLRAGMLEVSSITGKLEIARGMMRLKATLLQSDESRMILEGIAPFPGSGDEFDMAVQSEGFSLEFLRPFLKDSDWDFAGHLTADLNVTGTWGVPRFTGSVQAELADIAFGSNVILGGITGTAEMDGNAMLSGERAQSLALDVNLCPDRISPDSPPRNFARLTGTAMLTPGAWKLEVVDLTVDLANLNRLEVAGLFKGGLKGALGINKSFAAQPLVVTGEVMVRPGATLKLPTLGAVEPTEYGSEVMLGAYGEPLKIIVMPDCWVRHAPLMMDVALNGEVEVSGTVADPRFEGDLTAPRGSLVMFNRIVRLTGPATIRMRPEDEYQYGRMPHLFGTAAVELPGALATSHGELPVEILPSDLPLAPTEEDLTVFFGFNDMPLDALTDEESLDEINMYSEPPLSRQTIMVYLLGGQGLDVSPTGLQTFLGSEALAFSGSRLSRFLEESLDFKRFEIRALSSDEGTPFYLNMEKEFAPQFTVSYLRTFLEEVDERQEVSGKFYFDERYGAKTYVELMWRRRGQQQEEIVGNLGFNFRF